jgi:hypothetical protein
LSVLFVFERSYWEGSKDNGDDGDDGDDGGRGVRHEMIG